MFSSLLKFWSSTSDIHNGWIEWQKAQKACHFSNSYLYQYFLTHGKYFAPLKYSVDNTPQRSYYKYCFGDFTNLIVTAATNDDLASYVDRLLAIYDICKGFMRTYVKEPEGISILRKQDISLIIKHDFHQYDFDYTKLHAHTVAVYSLSTLLMLLLSNYLAWLYPSSRYTKIDLNKCIGAVDNKVFGEPHVYINPYTMAKSSYINIIKTEDVQVSTSCPTYLSSVSCSKCKNIVYNDYGSGLCFFCRYN